jgi:hypothetical protein
MRPLTTPVPRLPWLLWTAIVGFAVAAVSVPLLLRPHRTADWDAPKLLARLESQGLSLYVLYNLPDDAEGGCYLSTHPITREEASMLTLNPVCVEKWRGVVSLFLQKRDILLLLDEEIESWGECGLRLGRWVLFGDPELLKKIVEMTD